MAIIHEAVLQGSDEWLRLRLGRPTASEFDSLMTPLFKARDSEGREKYLARKIAEAVQGHAMPSFSSFATEQGSITETDAVPWYRLEHDDVRQVGFVESDDHRCGCSPDALVGEAGGLEVKSPAADTHVLNELRASKDASAIPKEYLTQVHGCLYVTGRQWWDFLSYRRHPFNKLVVRVPRDEEIIAKIDTILKAFYADFDAAMQKLGYKSKL